MAQRLIPVIGSSLSVAGPGALQGQSVCVAARVHKTSRLVSNKLVVANELSLLSCFEATRTTPQSSGPGTGRPAYRHAVSAAFFIRSRPCQSVPQNPKPATSATQNFAKPQLICCHIGHIFP